MPRRYLPLILTLLALPTLAACGSGNKAPEPPPPPSALSLKAIVDEPPADKVQLARRIDRLFDTEAVGETRALLVLHGGRTVAERYGEGYAAKTRLIGWSMTKCVTGLMIGLLVSDGRLRRSSPA